MHPILEARLAAVREKGLYRRLSPLPSSQPRFEMDGRPVLNFSSNDYLGLSAHPEVRQAAAAAALSLGAGAPASRLMSGHLELHEALEAELARLVGHEQALVFGSGFLANLGVLGALLGRGDEVYADKLNHASLIDGVRLSGAESFRFRHNDPAHLDDLLGRSQGRGLKLVAVESVFSMDGDLAPLAALVEVARRHGALLLADEAHALGVFGPAGGGLATTLPPGQRPDLMVATLGKALGGYGGFCGGSAKMRELLVNFARPFIFSTALPPATVAAALAAARIVREAPGLGDKLLGRVRFFREALVREGVELPVPQSQILAIVVGDNRRCIDLAAWIRARGVLVTAIRPPTVPAGTARLRLSVSLAHQEEELLGAARVIGEGLRQRPG